MLKIDWDLISRLEGGRVLRGYVPPKGKSGVTIATGIDLGYYGAANLKELPDDLQDKIRGYLGLVGAAAQRGLAVHPLVVTEQEAALIEGPKRKELTGALSAAFLRKAAVPFEQQPGAAQTVMMSVTWQYGAPWVDCPIFWAKCCARDWRAVEDELRNFGDEFAPRRKMEADYLAHNLPNG
jgi:hypothetical protein